MPLYLKKDIDNAQIAIWRLSEPLSFFIQQTTLGEAEEKLYHAISHEAKKKEFLASRHLLRMVVPEATTYKDEYDKPHLIDTIGDISIAHCTDFVTVMHCANQFVGIDIEPIHPKVERVTTKFLSINELAFIHPNHRVAHLIACWSIKEAVYKWYGKKSLSFKKDIIIEKFNFLSKGTALVKLKTPNSVYTLEISYQTIENCILAYTKL